MCYAVGACRMCWVNVFILACSNLLTLQCYSLQHGQIRLNLETHTQSFFNHFREHYINLPSFPGDQIVSTTYPSPQFTSPGTSFSPQMELYCTQHISNTTTHTGSKWWRCLWGRRERKPVSPLMAAEHNEDSHTELNYSQPHAWLESCSRFYQCATQWCRQIRTHWQLHANMSLFILFKHTVCWVDHLETPVSVAEGKQSTWRTPTQAGGHADSCSMVCWLVLGSISADSASRSCVMNENGEV